jgi:hypothetical protein
LRILAAKKKIRPELTLPTHPHDAALTPAPREQGEVEDESPVSIARLTLFLTLPVAPIPKLTQDLILAPAAPSSPGYPSSGRTAPSQV